MEVSENAYMASIIWPEFENGKEGFITRSMIVPLSGNIMMLPLDESGYGPVATAGADILIPASVSGSDATFKVKAGEQFSFNTMSVVCRLESNHYKKGGGGCAGYRFPYLPILRGTKFFEEGSGQEYELLPESVKKILGMIADHWPFPNGTSEAMEAIKPFAMIDFCESPIEKRFFVEAAMHGWRLRPQIKVGKYRLDLVDKDIKLAIELDGHDYHKTKDQRTRDANRDRTLMLKGWRTIRFTGSEVHRDVEKCVLQAIEIRDQMMENK